MKLALKLLGLELELPLKLDLKQTLALGRNPGKEVYSVDVVSGLVHSVPFWYI